MAFDGIVTMAETEELEQKLASGKIDKIYCPADDELVLYVHAGSRHYRVFASVSPEGASIRLIQDPPENPPSPAPFCMLLRKYIQGSRILSVSQKGAERIIEFTLENMNDLGLMVTRKLVFEIMGKHSNIILVDSLADDRILGAIKGVPSGISRAREVLPGRAYIYPPRQDKVPFTKADEAQLAAAGTDGKDVLRTIGGISPSIADELAELPTGEARRAFLDGIMQDIKDHTVRPVVYEDETGRPKEYHVTRLSAFERDCAAKTFATLSEAMEYYYEKRTSSNRMLQRSSSLKKTVRGLLEKAETKIGRLTEDLRRAEDSGKLQLYGELLTANLGKIERGAKEVTLANYYTGEDVAIPLDPKLGPNENAQKYFKRYRKSKTAVTEKKAQLAETKESADYLESVLTFLDGAESLSALAEIRDELAGAGYLKESGGRAAGRKAAQASPKEYRTSDGFPVLVGRNNRENDVLTLEIAGKQDYWLHTKDIPGSHVILRTGGAEPSETAIREAAGLAALNSKARASENVPVDYVKVKYVKKPSGAKPGMVIFTHNRTVYADPEEPPAGKD